ncbi:MAG TPA: hypothetical protein VL486_04475 [Verrucomicrobiae bacterium]|nr:hypothetical protein [Verrucomicrobiae bacterium]
MKTGAGIVEALKSAAGPVTRKSRGVRDRLARSWLRARLTSREEFIGQIKAALRTGRPYALGKIGGSEQHWLYYNILLKERTRPDKIEQFEQKLDFCMVKQAGVFPGDPQFCVKFNEFYVRHLKNLDCLGLFLYPAEKRIVQHYGLDHTLVHFVDQEPDRSRPDNEANCYLPEFRDKKILIVCPFASLLKERARKDIFEPVWSKTGKKWFHPRSVDALEFPYGFDPETHRRFPTAIDLFDHIATEIAKRDFDVALIAAAGLAIPIASQVKGMGKVGISLGGHLQALFGVIGKRWRDWADWKRDYFNEWWIEMPAAYRPRQTDVCDQGAYW